MSVEVLQNPQTAATHYDRGAVILHWLIAACLVGQILFGWYLGEIPRGSPARTIYVNFHKSTGILLGLLILIRLGWRLGHPAPALPSFMPLWERVWARWSHVGLYACMILMPLSGYVGSNFSKYGVNFMNAWKLPPWGVDDRSVYAFFNSTHVMTSYVFVALIVIHVAAAIRHAVHGDGVFSRMIVPRD